MQVDDAIIYTDERIAMPNHIGTGSNKDAIKTIAGI